MALITELAAVQGRLERLHAELRRLVDDADDPSAGAFIAAIPRTSSLRQVALVSRTRLPWDTRSQAATCLRMERCFMAVLKRHRAQGMPSEAYDQVATGVMDSQKNAPGFIAHYAIVEDGGITVIEIWESVAEHDAWFDPNVKPNLPPGTPEPTFAEIHNSNAK